ncbi:UNVERIFIED_ORG: hypothetical protein GGD51_000755 [Rhizobium esperanzae]
MSLIVQLLVDLPTHTHSQFSQEIRGGVVQTSQIDIAAFSTEHLSAAVNLSQQAGWSHRPEDCEMALAF